MGQDGGAFGGHAGVGGHDGIARRGHGDGRRVLVIEDEANISEAIRFILRRDGWNVAVCATGHSALQTVEGEMPDAIILDVMLPDENGYDILRALRRLPGAADLPVILLTARGGNAARDHAREAGASLFMAKPFSNGDLLAAVRQLVGV